MAQLFAERQDAEGVQEIVAHLGLAQPGEPYDSALIDERLRLQSTCRTSEFAQRAEEMYAVLADEHGAYLASLQQHLPELGLAAQKRVNHVIQELER